MPEATGEHIWRDTGPYKASMGRWSRPIAAAVLTWLAPALGLSWLNVGRGTGALRQATLNAAAPRQILGVDPSADFLATASARIVPVCA